MRTELVADALGNAAATTRIEADAIWPFDQGSVYTSAEFRALVTSLGMRSSMGRTGVPGNPSSESLFKTIKYDLSCPDRFDNLAHARSWTEGFLTRYATEHRHSGLVRHTPASVHFGTAAEVREQRQQALDDYWAQHSERFRRRPTVPKLPGPTGINTHLLSQTS